ncbi:MAG: hypothetical protein ACREMY_25110, partial [bacterium]
MLKITLKRALLVAALTISIAAQAEKLTNDQIAAKFVPGGFTEYAAENTYFAENRTWSVLPADLDHTGREDYLVVAYGNGHIGYLSVIRNGATPT